MSKQLYQVAVQHRFYCGRYYQYASRNIGVYAKSPKKANERVKNNLVLVESKLRSRKLKGRHIIKKSELYRLKQSDISNAIKANNNNHLVVI